MSTIIVWNAGLNNLLADDNNNNRGLNINLLADLAICMVINPRRMREGYGSRFVCLSVCLLPH